MSKAPNICAYCGNPGGSNEHFWGQWASKHLPQIYEGFEHELKGSAHGFAPFSAARKTRFIKRNLRKHKIRTICQRCNNGWMSSIAQSAKPILLRLGNSDWWNLSSGERKTLATWITVFIMSYEHLDPKTMASRQCDRKYVMKNKIPPDNWHIYLGEYEGAQWRENVGHTGMAIRSTLLDPTGRLEPQSDLPDLVNFQTTTSTFGSMLFNSLSFHGDAVELTDTFLPKQGLTKLWPLNGQKIERPTRCLNDADVDHIANRVFRTAGGR